LTVPVVRIVPTPDNGVIGVGHATTDYGSRGFRLRAGLGCRGAALRQERQPEIRT
jgi:hypothetical protein